MISKKSTIFFLLLIFVISFFIKLMPLYKGYNVPFGAVDSGFHIASALDISEGSFSSLVHPWWHLKNHVLINGYDIVDRNLASFFYPPFMHLALALGFLLIHPGIASVIIVSLLYSLSVIAIFLLCKSFGFRNVPALISSALIAVSVPLIQSQNYGFWTFLIATNFLILSYSFLRFKSRKSTWIGALFYFFALTTHWTFLIPAICIGLAESAINKNKEAKIYILAAILIAAPFYLYIFYLANPLSYIATHFEALILPNYALLMLALIGIAINFRKYYEVSIFAVLTAVISFIYYGLGMKFIFGDMVQFTYPFFTAFYVGSLFGNLSRKSFKAVLILIILAAFALDIASIQQIFNSSDASITKREFNDMLKLRQEFKPGDNTILAIDRNLIPWWLTIVSKDAKIVYPDTYEGEDMVKYYDAYFAGEINSSKYVFYKISKKGNSLVLEKNATLPKGKFGFRVD